jgi:hypothetical protein
MNQEMSDNYIMKTADELAVIYTKLADLASSSHVKQEGATTKNISAIASLVNLVRVSVLGGFYEEGKLEMLDELKRAVENIENIQET